MKKIMETRFHFVGTLEEAEFNRVVSSSSPWVWASIDSWQFAGRNWNHGQVREARVAQQGVGGLDSLVQSIELVLRGPSGRFLPLPYITSVMCHEASAMSKCLRSPFITLTLRRWLTSR